MQPGARGIWANDVEATDDLENISRTATSPGVHGSNET
jgi:hypothetical protein